MKTDRVIKRGVNLYGEPISDQQLGLQSQLDSQSKTKTELGASLEWLAL